MFAVQEGHELCAQELLEAGADVNITSKEGYTALYLAIRNKHYQCVDLLLKYDATAPPQLCARNTYVDELKCKVDPVSYNCLGSYVVANANYDNKSLKWCYNKGTLDEMKAKGMIDPFDETPIEPVALPCRHSFVTHKE